MSDADPNENVAHLASYRTKPEIGSEEDVIRRIDLRLASMLQDHFREQTDLVRQQNERLEQQNRQMSEKISRLLGGMDRLLSEMEAVRSGKQEEAFARVARHDEEADLPTIQADAAVLYPYTSGDIGERLGFGATQIGVLLGRQGLGWSTKGTYEETTRWKPGRQRFWHKDVPEKLTEIFLTREPDEFGITNKSIRTMFKQFRTRVAAASETGQSRE